MSEIQKSREKQRYSEQSSTIGQYRSLLHGGMICSNCKQTVAGNFELCPNCGYRLHSTYCTYCGAPMSAEDLFCGECGGSIKGIPCPSCGTLSFRSFCPNCNQPVDDLGKEECKKANNDPIYQRICSLTEQIILAQENKKHSSSNNAISPVIADILERYHSLEAELAKSNELQEANDDKYVQGVTINETKGIQLVASQVQDFDISSAITEINNLMSQMLPDPGLPPQIQRNYYSARKVAVVRKSIVKERVGWVCNLCGCLHNSPSGCARPELGGTWVYNEKEITTKTYE